MGHGCEHIGTMGRGPFDTVSVVNAAFARLVIDVKVLEVVVEVDTACAEVTAQQRSMRGENGGDIDVAFPAEGDGHPSLPLVEVSYYGLVELPRDVLHAVESQYLIENRSRARLTSPRNHATM